MPELSLSLPKSKPMWKLSAGMQTLSKGLWRLVREKPLGAFGGMLVLVLLLCALFAHWIAPYPYDETNVRQRLKPPGAQILPVFWRFGSLLKICRSSMASPCSSPAIY